MAVCKLAPGILAIRGRLGGVYFKRGPDGTHCQAMPRHWTYQHSALQQGSYTHGSPYAISGITGFSGVSALWGLALLGAMSLLWAAFALIYYFEREGEDRKKISGYNWFMHFGMTGFDAGRPPYFRPPRSPGELPNFVALWEGTYAYSHPPTDWPPECMTGQYYQSEDYNGKATYINDDRTWLIWWKDPLWVLSSEPGFEPPTAVYYSQPNEISGFYRNYVIEKGGVVYFGTLEEKIKPH